VLGYGCCRKLRSDIRGSGIEDADRGLQRRHKLCRQHVGDSNGDAGGGRFLDLGNSGVGNHTVRTTGKLQHHTEADRRADRQRKPDVQWDAAKFNVRRFAELGESGWVGHYLDQRHLGDGEGRDPRNVYSDVHWSIWQR
jgi:hypothetical protein